MTGPCKESRQRAEGSSVASMRVGPDDYRDEIMLVTDLV
jgi:hypothetical protein